MGAVYVNKERFCYADGSPAVGRVDGLGVVWFLLLWDGIHLVGRKVL